MGRFGCLLLGFVLAFVLVAISGPVGPILRRSPAVGAVLDGINVGALVGHSALRYYVMGADSQERVATDAEIAAMCELLEGAMAAGAIGLSTSYVDIDENLRPVPSRWADMREKTALCRAMAKSGRGTLQTVPI